MATCERLTFQQEVTRIDADWLNAIDKIKVLLNCSETKEQAQAVLDIVPRAEYQTAINNLQAQINTLVARVDSLEACLDGYCIKVVSALPATPAPKIIYYVTG